MKKTIKVIVVLVAVGILSAGGVLCYANWPNLFSVQKKLTEKDFNIKRVHSSVDFNRNGVDDYTDILLGARKDAKNKPKYDGSYHNTGYPPDNIGVCTDVVWRAFKNAGYNLKEMIDMDIAVRTAEYPRVNGKPDPKIDFRRVPNLKVYFEKYAIQLTTDLSKIEQWQPGDIVTFGTYHVGIVSDIRNSEGVPFIIHNGGQSAREEDALGRLSGLSGHFRFDASGLKKTKFLKKF